MAYASTKLITPATIQILFDWICASLVTMGWTLHDNVSATSKVYKSNAEAGDRIYEYIHLVISSTNIQIRPYGWWDSTGHAGSCANYWDTSQQVAYLITSTYYMYGSKDLCVVKIVSGGFNVFGHIANRFHTTPLATLTGAATAGSDVVIDVTNTTAFSNGKYVQIFGAAGEGRDWVKVKTVGVDQLTIETLPRNYGIGSLIGACPSLFGGQNTHTSIRITCPILASGTAASSPTGGSINYQAMISPTVSSPDDRLGTGTGASGKYILQPLYYIETGDAANAGIADDNILATYGGSALDDLFGINAAAFDESGTATAGGAATLTCAGKTWGTTQFIGKIVIITAGTGLGQTRQIQSHSDTVLDVSAWEVVPDVDTEFKIVDEVYRCVYYSAGSMALVCKEIL